MCEMGSELSEEARSSNYEWQPGAGWLRNGAARWLLGTQSTWEHCRREGPGTASKWPAAQQSAHREAQEGLGVWRGG